MRDAKKSANIGQRCGAPDARADTGAPPNRCGRPSAPPRHFDPGLRVRSIDRPPTPCRRWGQRDGRPAKQQSTVPERPSALGCRPKGRWTGRAGLKRARKRWWNLPGVADDARRTYGFRPVRPAFTSMTEPMQSFAVLRKQTRFKKDKKIASCIFIKLTPVCSSNRQRLTK
jgi:hypothetical protein